ncbi:hypothetical protein [Marinobacterium lutimaris]|uniref:General secretion pathway protein L n=1 Tax=Marinobacterium lutimaris TaxID=568106 RepID=A0A1H6DH75_9GAMM|nr:hypothetical protein [Marinobacterium lutimaris]SEG84025.1 general secretion pathway protein L [Marinobacterium lutimaris]
MNRIMDVEKEVALATAAATAQTASGRKRWFGASSREELLLRPASPGLPDEGAGLCWLQRRHGETQASGRGLPPSQCRRLPVTLVLQGADASLFDVVAPPGLKAQEYALLLEEQLLSDPETQQIVKLSQAEGRLQLLACDKSLLHSWQAWLAEQGFRLTRVLFDLQLMPPVPGGVLGWQGPANLLLLKAADKESAGGFLSWPGNQVPALPEKWAVQSWREYSNEVDELEALAAAGSSAATSLLKPTRQAKVSGIKLPAGLRRPLQLTAVAAFAYLLATGVFQWREQQAANQLLPQRLGLGSSADLEQVQRQLTRQLRMQQLPLQQLSETEVLTTALSDWLAQHPQWRLQRLGNSIETGFHASLIWQGEGETPALEQIRESWSAQLPEHLSVNMALEILDGKARLQLSQLMDAEVQS